MPKKGGDEIVSHAEADMYYKAVVASLASSTQANKKRKGSALDVDWLVNGLRVYVNKANQWRKAEIVEKKKRPTADVGTRPCSCVLLENGA